MTRVTYLQAYSIPPPRSGMAGRAPVFYQFDGLFYLKQNEVTRNTERGKVKGCQNGK